MRGWNVKNPKNPGDELVIFERFPSDNLVIRDSHMPFSTPMFNYQRVVTLPEAGNRSIP
jgi:hypothetical protein